MQQISMDSNKWILVKVKGQTPIIGLTMPVSIVLNPKAKHRILVLGLRSNTECYRDWIIQLKLTPSCVCE